MKVAELKPGMIIEPIAGSAVFILRPALAGDTLGYVTVRTLPYHGKAQRYATKTNRAMYLGDRKSANVSKKDFSFSNRFVLVDGIIAAVDPSCWIYIKKTVS